MIKNDNYNHWENCIHLGHGNVSLVIVPQAGGRIISIKYRDAEFCRQNTSQQNPVCDGPVSPWPNWGGDFDWIGPQESWNKDGWPPPYELDGGVWNLVSHTADSVTLESDICSLGVSIRKTVTIGQESVTVSKCMNNAGGRIVRFGIWNITQVPLTGLISIPVTGNDLPTIKLFPFPRAASVDDLMQRGIVRFCRNEGTNAVILDETKGHFKIGMTTFPCIIRYRKGDVTMEKTVNGAGKGAYPHGCNIEIYRDERSGYTELEQLGELVTLKPGEQTTLDQVYRFY